jgi:hypothetical protein
MTASPADIFHFLPAACLIAATVKPGRQAEGGVAHASQAR